MREEVCVCVCVCVRPPQYKRDNHYCVLLVVKANWSLKHVMKLLCLH